MNQFLDVIAGPSVPNGDVSGNIFASPATWVAIVSVLTLIAVTVIILVNVRRKKK